MATNEYGLDSNYFKKKLRLVVRDVDNYTPDEMFNELSRLAEVARRSGDHAEAVSAALSYMRDLRDTHELGSEIRGSFNSACNRLDVLHSKLANLPPPVELTEEDNGRR